MSGFGRFFTGRKRKFRSLTPAASWIARATTPPEITHWWNPATGSDSNDGLSKANAKKTFTAAVDTTVAATGVLGIVNGTYNETDTADDVQYLAQYENLTPGYNLWIRAETEREAIFETDGRGAFGLQGATNVTLWGITAHAVDNESQDSSNGLGVFDGKDMTDCKFIRCLVSKVNNGVDMYGYVMNRAVRTYFEECEVYDFYRHGFSMQLTKGCHLRRCYANARLATATAGNPDHTSSQQFNEGINGYRANNLLVENCPMEGGSVVETQCDFLDGELGGHDQYWLGNIVYGGEKIFPTYFRDAGTHWNVLHKHTLLLDTTSRGLHSETDFATYENMTIINTSTLAVLVSDIATDDMTSAHETAYTNLTGDWPPKPRIRWRNSLLANCSAGAYTEDAGITLAEATRDYIALWNNGGTDTGSDPKGNNLDDASLAANVFTNSTDLSSTPFGEGTFGLNAGSETVVYVPDSHSTLANANSGRSGIDQHMGCTILYRYEGTVDDTTAPTETLTTKALWDPDTGKFPHGAVITGYNDQDSAGSANENRSLHTLHTRLGVSSSTLPSGYGT